MYNIEKWNLLAGNIEHEIPDLYKPGTVKIGLKSRNRLDLELKF